MPEPTPASSSFIVDDTVHVSVSRPEGPGEAIPFLSLDDIPSPRSS